LPDPEDASHLAACWRRIAADPRLPGASWLKSSPAGGLILLHLASSAATVFVLGLPKKYKLQDWANPRLAAHQRRVPVSLVASPNDINERRRAQIRSAAKQPERRSFIFFSYRAGNGARLS